MREDWEEEIPVNTAFSYLEVAQRTDVGKRRRNNEDAILSLPQRGLFCVADGMGGVQGGEVASKATVDALAEAFTVWPEARYAFTAVASARLVERALNNASRWIRERGEERGVTGTGSTAVVLVFDRAEPSRALVLHAGDSRAYRYRNGKLIQISADHSVAAAAGLSDDKFLPAMFRGVITRAVGLEKTVSLETTATDVLAGDVFLLCSDGLTKMLSDRQIQKLLRRHRADTTESGAGILIDEALKSGGEDNVSVIVVRVGADLPQGPTLDIPPETRALEERPAADAATAPPNDEAPTENEAAPTGQTVDDTSVPTPAYALLSDTADGDCSMPTTPTSATAGTTPADMDPAVGPDAATPAGRTLTKRMLVGGAILLMLAAAIAAGLLLNR